MPLAKASGMYSDTEPACDGFLNPLAAYFRPAEKSKTSFFLASLA